jgi:hypothetical protein
MIPAVLVWALVAPGGLFVLGAIIYATLPDPHWHGSVATPRDREATPSGT